MGLKLVTDRTAADAALILTLRGKGWEDFTPDERAYWLRGNPIDLYDAAGARLISADGYMLQCRDGVIRGAYNFHDLNRVGHAVNYLADLMIGYGYSISVASKTDWVVEDVPRVEQMTHYLDCVSTLKEAFYGSTPLPADMDDLTVEDANNIEKLLLEIETNINHMIASFFYCGEICAGEV